MRKKTSVTIDSGPPETTTDKACQMSKSQSLIRLTAKNQRSSTLLNLGLITVLFALPQHVQAQACEAGWSGTYPSCTALYGGSAAAASVPGGSYGPKGTASTIACPKGWFCTGAEAPAAVSAGFYAVGSTSAQTTCGSSGNCLPYQAASACATTQFTSVGTAWKVCHSCPIGYVCNGATASTTSLTAGKYATGGASAASTCTANNFCPDTTTGPQACPSGFESTAGLAACTATAAGKSSSTMNCGAGYYRRSGDSNGCTICPVGFFCPNAANAYPTVCGAGTYSSSTGQSSCTSCPAGSYCLGANQIVTCPNGQYSSSGLSSCNKCLPGNYCVNGAQTACSTNYWSDFGATSCTLAYNGYGVDSTKASKGTKCGSGYYSNSATSYACTVCPQGYKCPLDGNGVYSYTTACSASEYCPKGTVSPTTCPDWYDCTNYKMCDDGSYLASDKVTCTQCEAGYTCYNRAWSGRVAVDISTGYYSPLGASMSQLCPPGYDCTGHSTATLCASGYYSVEGQVTCLICPVGWACPTKDMDYSKQINCANQRGMYNDVTGATVCKISPAGYYTVIGTNTPVMCPTGTWSAAGSQGCHECPAGYACTNNIQNTNGQNTPYMTPCIQGSYQDLTNQVACKTCPAGSYCLHETIGSCPTFKYSYANWGFCLFAPAGYYLATNTDITLCSSGTYSLFGSGDSTLGSATCRTCPIGHQCNDPTILPQACPPGTYQPSTGQSTCLSCASGTYSLFMEKECHQAPGGYKLASTSNVPRMCPPGTISSAGDSSCTTISDLYYTVAASTATQSCPTWGFYCYQSGGVQYEVPSTIKLSVAAGTGGYYLPTISTSLDASTDLVQCPAGWYCPYGLLTKYPCPGGHYCEAGSSRPTACSIAMFNPNILGTSISSCTSTCPSGYTCNSGAKYPILCSGTCNAAASSTAVVTCAAGTYAGNDLPSSASACNTCWQGYYCPEALASLHTFPTPCPKGTYQPFTGKSAATDCQTCPAGMVCPYYAARSLATGLVCQPGYACLAKTTGFRQNPCPSGKFSNTTPFLSSIGGCTTCPDGYMCSSATNVLYNPMTVCPAGYYCVAGVQTACPAGTFSFGILATSASSCTACPAGYYCGEATTDYSANLCAAGYYCIEGSSTATPDACPAGTFSTQTGLKSSSECTICPVGQYCLAGTTVPVNCPAGTYSSRISVVVLTDGASRGCLPCPIGYYCPSSPTYEPIACSPGTYNPSTSQTVCLTCPLNSYCDSPAMTTYTAIEAGFYYTGGTGLAIRPYAPLYSCPAGYYCTGNTRTACPTGTYQPYLGQISSTACLTTPAGFYNDQTGSTGFWDNPCPTGMYCLAGTKSKLGVPLASVGTSNAAIICPAGTFRSQTMARSAADCGACPAGYSCSEMCSEPTICSPGYYCPQASSTMLPCASGTFGSGYGLTASTDCSPCFGGRYCLQTAQATVGGLCDQMYYCVEKSNTPTPQYSNLGTTTDFTGKVFPIGDQCAAGGYCGAGSKFPLPCPPGKYNPNIRGQTTADCSSCPAGKYCNGFPSLTRTDILADMRPYVPSAQPTGSCYAGYYCTGGAYSPKQFTAQPGYFTLAGASAQSDCQAPTYNPFQAQSSCLTCPAGYYCNTARMTAPIDCPQGYYCPKGTQNYLSNPCPVGTYGLYKNLQSSSDCQKCTTGSYCASTALTAVTGTCSAGYYCQISATTATPSGTSSWSFGQCPRHHFCAAGVGVGTPSLAGFFDTSIGLSVQTTVKIPAGQWSHTVSVTSTYISTPTIATGSCQAGYYCPAGSTWAFDSTHYCGIGQYCPTGTANLNSATCSAGYYQPNSLQSACYLCLKGFYCPAGVQNDLTLNICPKGYYCPTGTSSATQYPCQVGTYNDHTGATSSTECIPAPPGYYISTTATTGITTANKCSAGYYCTSGSTSSQQYTCQPGYYCPQGSPTPILCTAGYACRYSAMSAPSTSDVCNAGTYCPQGASSVSGTNCPSGYYCPQGSAAPTPCPAGTYSGWSGRTSLSNCYTCTGGYACPTHAMTAVGSQCTAGFYCPAGSRTTTATVCPAGYYCPTGSTSPTACSSNMFQDETGSATCKQCPAGYYCTSTTATKCTPQLEGPNYYCLGGTSMDKISCPSGTYNYFDGSYLSTDCWSCPQGYFCPSNAASADLKIQVCPAGSYCLAGVAAPTTCVAGFYCPEGTNVPIPCPNGMYCDTTGLSAPTGTCSGGYICQTVQTAYYSINALCINYLQAGCVRGSLSPTPSDSICPAGYYCQAGAVIPSPCPIGTYNPYTGKDEVTDCIACTGGNYCYMAGATAIGFECEAGYYCSSGSSEQTQEECPQGSYCPAGSTAPIPCPAGQYQSDEVQQNCLACSNGWYCEGTGLTSPTICPVGYYCNSVDGSTTTPLPCPKGTFSNLEGLSSSSQCQSCPYGKYCDELGMTAPGYASDCSTLQYCYDPNAILFTSVQMNALDCVAGQICATNTIVPKICGPGTYSDANAPSAVSNCIACPANKYCPDWGLTTATLKSCPDGYVCLGGAIDPSNLDGVTIKLCPAGSRCKLSAGITQELCQVNYFNPSLGQTSCQACLAGFSCQEIGLIQPAPCPAGSYCPAYDASSGVPNVNPCPAGTYSSNKYLKSSSECISCPPGRYCVAGSATFTGFCAAGYVCTGGQSTSTPTGTFAFTDYSASYSGPCPVGYFCPYGSSYPRPCAAGYYQDQTGQSTCKACTTGYYCPQRGLAAPVGTCAPGYYCIKGSILYQPYDYQTGRICATGHYCVNGLEYQCEDGAYAPVNGLDQCYDCPPGFYCNNDDGTITPLECTTGNYCPRRTGTPTQCPNGTYTQNYQVGLERKDQCSNCPTGYYCNDGLFDNTQKCKAGYYCHSGASEPAQKGLECPMGYYCTSGTKLPTACPDGKYSLLGAKSEDDCRDCIAGFYCVRYIKSSAMIACPAGYYCPAGVNEPIPCPVGTYNVNSMTKSYDKCLPCPEGTACDVTGIADYSKKLCPPGYYCPLGSYVPTPCPAGNFRPNQGGAKPGPLVWSLTVQQPVAACYSCVPGYYCPVKATVVPEVCPRGKYCPLGSADPLDCPPGFYCTVNTALPTPCPPGFYCIGRSDVYIKCPFGSYCPRGSKAPINCPNGMYGSGNANNFDLASGCLDCGRGLYSQDDPTQCNDCTPGYVCTGKTSSRTPMNTTQGGYQCPVGFYCPKGSYRPQQCPIGTYSKYPGAASLQKCLPCKVDWYNDLPGQGGCKKCGPTSYSNGGADTCICVGANRNFVKSLGSCLCATGYKPKDNGTNVDSSADCELIVRSKCDTTQQVSLTGECLSANQQVQECNKQCPGVGGKMISGTGLCQCKSISDISEVCDSTCQKKMPQTTLGNDGKMQVKDPVTGKTSQVDPSTIPGYFGDFKCKTTSTAADSCKVQTMGMTDDGSFTYEFQPNQAILNATNIPNNTQYTSPAVRAQKLKAQGRILATVEQSTVPRLKNPVMCIKAGDIVFFNVVPKALNYPVFYKDSILNQNPDKFDQGPFLNLEKMINQGVDVSTFSYVFSQPGTFLFQNKASGTVTTITVVADSQKCGGGDGAPVSQVTSEALSNMNIQSSDKSIRPDWWFISISIIAIVSFVFFVMGLFILSHNKNQKGSNMLFEQDKNSRESSIYYDKAIGQKDVIKPCCFGLCKVRANKVDNKKEDSGDSSDEALIQKKHEYAIKYKDLENLLADFNRAQEVLNRQLIDREKLKNRFVDENGNLIEKQNNEDALVQEVQKLLTFVQQNRSALNTALNANKDQDNAQADERNKQQNLAIDGLKSELTKKVALQLQDLYRKNLQMEMAFTGQLEQQTQAMQNEAYEKENQRNDRLKQKLLDEYQKRLTDSNLNERDREALLAELHAKLSHINDLAAQEQEEQNHNLKQMLERRKQKKDKLQVLLNNLGDKKIKEDDHYQQKLMDIKQREMNDKRAVDDEMEELRKQSISSIQDELNQKRLKSVSEQEKRLEDFKRKQGKGHNPEAELIFADMLASYGNHVKKLDADLAKEKEIQVAKLEQKLKDRKQARLREIEEQRKQKEQMLNTDTVNTNSKLTTEMKQLESLLHPIKDEQARMEIIINQNKTEQAIAQTVEDQPIELSQASQAAMKEITNTDNKAIQTLLNKIDVENEIKRREIEQQKEMINRQIANCVSDDERYRLMKQLEAFETNLQQQLAQQQEIQNQNLKEAIDARKRKRDQAMEKVNKEKSDKIFKMFRTQANNKVLDIQSPDQLKQLVHRIQAGFNKDEAVQVTENHLDQKNQHEIINLMNSLFEERAEALRKFISDLLSQKQTELALLQEEFEPQKEFLRQKRVKQLLSLEDFSAALERLTLEETERHQDIEIAYADKEKQIKQELELLKIEAETESLKLLKDRQTKERVIMFGEMIKSMDDKDQMKTYLTKSLSDLQRETEQYKRYADKEKSQKMIEIKEEQERKMKELHERQERLVNVDEQIKKDEAKYMERYKRQREEMLARKLADQQRELLKDMNQKDVDAMLDRHKRDLKAMDDVLVEEQNRQMETMRERMKGRNAAKAREQVVRQIKLAEIQKAKAAEIEKAKHYEAAGGDLGASLALTSIKEQVGRLVEKANMMQRVTQKQCYSRRIYFKRHIVNQQKLNAFLGRGILTDWASSKGGDLDEFTGMSALSLKTQDLRDQVNEREEKITYSVLLQHIQNAEQHYDAIRKNQ